MIGLAKHTGDVTRNPITLNRLAVEHRNFWTSHFGGVYVFSDLDHPATISVGPTERLGNLPTPQLFDLQDRNKLARFLDLNRLVEPIVRARNVDGSAILGQKMDFILVAAGAALDLDLGGASRRELRKIAQQLGSRLPAEFHGLGALKRWAESGGEWPKINSEHPAYFYTLRAAPHPDRDLVNQLLAELTPLDVRQLFICHKQLFYSLYKDWPEQKKQFVADFLEREYQVDKAGTRRALFGGDDDMTEKPENETDRMIDLVGPWGAFRRGRR